ncbi:MAG: C39 family peptidase [Anaerolineaceae bacterium]|nr:C39 family peptidase [Anaerolineaceae bacterium]
MLKGKSVKRFPWLTLLGTLFALMICVTFSGMIFIVYPQSGHLLQLFLSDSKKSVLYSSSHQIFSNEPTPFQPLPTKKVTLTPMPTPSPEPIPTVMISPTLAKEPTLALETSLKEPPPYSYISEIYGSPQLYTLDCESQAAVDWARYFGIHINELEFIERLPRSDDPDEGFVGNINGPMGQIPPRDYGVYPGPIAELLRDYGLNATPVRNWDLNSLKREISAGRPVIVWIINLPFAINTSEYTASNGNTTIVAPFQHTWIVTGYNANTITVIDSKWTYNVKTASFIERWNALGNQAVIMVPE